MKVRKNSGNLRPGFVDSFASQEHGAKIFRISDNWWIKNLASENEVGKIYLTSIFIFKPLQFSDSSGSNITG